MDRTLGDGWLVARGTRVAGPVTSSVLRRAMQRGIVGDECQVRKPAWPSWRPWKQVREARVVRPEDASPAESFERWLDGATDPAELVHLVLLSAVRITSAFGGVGSVRRSRGFVTTCTFGPLAEGKLGTLVGSDDPALAHAGAGAVFVGEVEEGSPAALVVARRLGGDYRGVAVVPVLGYRRVLGFVELGRTDHPFRRGDRCLLEQLVWSARLRTG